MNRRARRLSPPGPLLTELCRERPGIGVTETRSLADLEATARTLARREDVKAVVLAGGDGAYMAGVTALARAWGSRPLPPIALAPGGTVGIVARNWGLKGDPVRWVKRLLDGMESDAIASTERPTLRVHEVGGTERVGFIFGTGLVAHFFELYESRGATGNRDALRIALRVFAGSFVGARLARTVLEPIPCEVTVDGALVPFDRVSLLCASVVRDLGLKLRLTYRAGSAEHRFHTVATPLASRWLGPQMPLVLAARPLVGPRLDALTADLQLRFAPGRGVYVLDGELLRADAIRVTPGPTLQVLSPR